MSYILFSFVNFSLSVLPSRFSYDFLVIITLLYFVNFISIQLCLPMVVARFSSNVARDSLEIVGFCFRSLCLCMNQPNMVSTFKPGLLFHFVITLIHLASSFCFFFFSFFPFVHILHHTIVGPFAYYYMNFHAYRKIPNIFTAGPLTNTIPMHANYKLYSNIYIFGMIFIQIHPRYMAIVDGGLWTMDNGYCYLDLFAWMYFMKANNI